MAVDGRDTRVLLIEDNIGDARLLAELVSECAPPAFAIERAGTLKEGLDRLGARRYDVVVLDLSLPDSSELETLHAVTCRHPDVPIVVLTGLEDETLGMRAVQAGAQDFVPKDEMTGTHVSATLRFAIERHRLRRSLQLNAARAQASLLRFRNVFERTADGIVVMDESGRILSANPTAERMLGASSEDLMGTEFPVDIPIGARRVHETHPPGGTRRIETHVTRTVWGGKRARLASMRDVTEHVRVGHATSSVPDVDDDW